MASRPDTDEFDNDPGRWGHSLVNLAELVTGCLDAVGARSVGEVGAWAGDLTRTLLEWAAPADARVIAIDPQPHDRLVELASQHPELEVIPETSHDALRSIQLPDALIIDGDHNYYTVSEDLRLIEERAAETEIPLVLLHDVGWPHARRDSYFARERIPKEHRQPAVGQPMLFPGEPEPVEKGLLLYNSARREGGPRNGVLTAVEDFFRERPELRFALVPVFFGLGILWHPNAPGAASLAKWLAPWDHDPVLARLEANRVYHLASSSGRSVELAGVQAELDEQKERNATQRRVLKALLDSRGLRLLDRLSALRHPHRDWSWPGRLRMALAEGVRRPAPPSDATPARPVLTWQGQERCVVGDTVFQTLPAGFFEGFTEGVRMKGADFLVAKPPSMIDRYVELIDDLRPQRIFELGVFTGGSTALLYELARPDRLTAVDLSEMGSGSTASKLLRWVSRRGLSGAVRVHGEVDQADRTRLAEIVDQEFGAEPLDLVVDDCSHLYDATRASFNELFPRLRPGGLYVIEDWHWAHTELGREPLEGLWPDETPLTRLIFELLLAEPSVPGLIAEITVETGSARVVRGGARLDPRAFDISACSNARGRRLLEGGEPRG